MDDADEGYASGCAGKCPPLPPGLLPLKVETCMNAALFELFCPCPHSRVSHHMLKLSQMISMLHSEVIRGVENGETGGFSFFFSV